MGTVQLGPACGRIMLDFNGALCLLVPGHLGPCDAGPPPVVCGADVPANIDPVGETYPACELECGHGGPHRLTWED